MPRNFALVREIDGGGIEEISFNDLRRDNPNISFSAEPTEQTLRAFNCYRLVEAGPDSVGPYDDTRFDVVRGEPTKTGNTYRVTYRLEPVSAQEQQRREAVKAADREEALNNALYRDAHPLFFKWQLGEATEQEWRDAVQAVRDLFP